MSTETLLSATASAIVGPFERWTRRMWGLPTGQGFWAEHPSVIRSGFFGKISGRRAPGYVKDSTVHETSTWEEAHDATSAGERYAPTHHGANGGFRKFEKRRGYDFTLHRWHQNAQRGFGEQEGRYDALRSVSLGEDIWHILTVDMSLPRLLLLDVLVEFAFILFGAVMLALVAAAEGNALGGDLISAKLMLSLTTVRISSAAIFGWQERTPSTKPEVLILALLGWAHWWLLSVAGAIIVSRALRPLQQLALAPDCVVNDEDVAIRMIILRSSVVLYDVKVQIKLGLQLKSGKDGNMMMNLPLTNDSYGTLTGIPYTLRHDRSDPKSPLKGIELNEIRTVNCTDGSGNPVMAHAQYTNPITLMMMSPMKGSNGGDRIYPRILRGKFADQIRVCLKASKLLLIVYNMDTFHVVKQEREDASPVQTFLAANILTGYCIIHTSRPSVRTGLSNQLVCLFSWTGAHFRLFWLPRRTHAHTRVRGPTVTARASCRWLQPSTRMHHASVSGLARDAARQRVGTPRPRCLVAIIALDFHSRPHPSPQPQYTRTVHTW
ncbi:hypothetical protein N9F40_00675 [bacterium]|nr:hypothetical protein [bacterium]